MSGAPATLRAGALPIALLLVAASGHAQLRPRPLAGIRAQAATLIVQGIEGGSLPIAVTTRGDETEAVDGAEGAMLRLPIALEVASKAVGTEGSALEFYIYALSTDGAVVAHKSMAFDVPGGHQGRTGLKLLATLDLPPGRYQMRFLVLDPESHRFGLRQQSLVLDESLPALGRPRTKEPCRDWTIVATALAPPSEASALPVLQMGTRIELFTVARGRAADSLEGALTAHLEPRSAESGEPHTATTVYRVRPGDSGEHPLLELAFELPQIGRGVYDLSLTLDDGSTKLRSPAIEAWVVDAQDLESSDDHCARSWSRVIAHSMATLGPERAAAESAASSDRARPKRRGGGGEKLRKGYREVLRGLATSGDVEAAAVELGTLEERVFERALPQGLLRNQVDVARKLAAEEPEILAPVMMLHHQAYLEHYRQRRLALAGHSRRIVQQLAQLLAERARSDESRVLASDILTSLAELGHRRQTYALSQLLLQDALALEPDNQNALLLLAVNYEWFGRYDEASRLLEHLVDVAATHHEARLRLGIMRFRAGDTAQAELHFSGLLKESAPPWLLSLTYQALVELYCERERFVEAVELLEQGRQRLRGDQRLHLLSAYALERVGRNDEASQLLAALPIDGSVGSPRFRYGESLTSPLDAMRQEIDRGVAVRLPLLGRAVGLESPLEIGR